MKKIVSLVLFLALVVAIVLYAAGAFHGDQVQPGTVDAPPGLPAPARTAQAERATVPVVEDAVGTVTARTTVQVAAQVQARVKTVHADAGQRVTAGRPLVDLDDRDLVARRAEAGEGLAQAEAAHESAVQAKARAEAVKEQASKRFERVAEPPRREGGDARDDGGGRGRLPGGRGRGGPRPQAAIAAADARIQQAKQVVEQADVAQGYAQIAVPITGVVSQKSVEEGDLAWPGKTLYEIMDPTDLRLEAQVREGLIARVEDGTEFQVVIPALGRTVAGMVSEVCPVADPAEPDLPRARRVRAPAGRAPRHVRAPAHPARGPRGRERCPPRPSDARGQLESVVVQAADGRWTRRMVTTGRALRRGQGRGALGSRGRRDRRPPGDAGDEPATGEREGLVQKLVRASITGPLSPLLIIISIAAGIVAVTFTPREEEPQIVVPMADVFVSFPGASAEEVEKLVATPLEKLLWQVDGVEHVYSMSRRDHAMVTVRFFVGEDRENALIRLQSRIASRARRRAAGRHRLGREARRDRRRADRHADLLVADRGRRPCCGASPRRWPPAWSPCPTSRAPRSSAGARARCAWSSTPRRWPRTTSRRSRSRAR